MEGGNKTPPRRGQGERGWVLWLCGDDKHNKRGGEKAGHGEKTRQVGGGDGDKRDDKQSAGEC